MTPTEFCVVLATIWIAPHVRFGFAALMWLVFVVAWAVLKFSA
jgi:hypothetical protein